MRPIYILSKLDNSPNKFKVVLPSGKTIRFGDSRYDDYTKHKDEARKESYLARHAKNEDWNDLSTAGAWSRWLLWNKPTISESMRDIEKRFNINIKKV